MDISDRVVIAQIKAGNINKFEILVDRYSTKIRLFIVSKLFDKEEADDIVQNSFVQFYKAIMRFDVTKPVYPYLLQIARNELNMYFRKHHMTISLNEEIIHSPEKEIDENPEEILRGLKLEYKKALSWFAQGTHIKKSQSA